MKSTRKVLEEIIFALKGQVKRSDQLIQEVLLTQTSKNNEGHFLEGIRVGLHRVTHALEEVRKERNSVCKACDHNILFHAPAPFSIQAQNGGSPWCEGESFKGSKTDCGCKEFILQEEEEVKS